MTFVLVATAFAFWIFVRESDKFQGGRARRALTKFGRPIWFLWALANFFLITDGRAYGFFVFLPGMALLAHNKYAEWRAQRGLHQQCAQLVTEVCIDLRVGRGWRDSVRGFLHRRGQNIASQLREALERGLFSQDSGALALEFPLADLGRLLSQMEARPHLALSLAESLHSKIDLALDFRQKSWRALGQVWIQVVVLTILYLTLLGFMLSQSSGQEMRFEILGSIFLFLTGQVTLILLTRSFKWKD